MADRFMQPKLPMNYHGYQVAYEAWELPFALEGRSLIHRGQKLKCPLSKDIWGHFEHKEGGNTTTPGWVKWLVIKAEVDISFNACSSFAWRIEECSLIQCLLELMTLEGCIQRAWMEFYFTWSPVSRCADTNSATSTFPPSRPVLIANSPAWPATLKVQSISWLLSFWPGIIDEHVCRIYFARVEATKI